MQLETKKYGSGLVYLDAKECSHRCVSVLGVPHAGGVCRGGVCHVPRLVPARLALGSAGARLGYVIHFALCSEIECSAELNKKS